MRPNPKARGNRSMSVLFGYITVFFGAGIGGLLRLAANRAGIYLSLSFPWSTLFVNVSGSLAIGLIAGWFALRGQAGQTLRLFLTTGVLGGYTTFSTFALDTALLWERGQVWGTAFYVASSVLLSIAGAFLGLAIIRQLPS
jgi:fluoride exporter